MTVESINGKTGVVVIPEVVVLPGESTAIGTDSLVALSALSTAEQETHRGNTAVGWNAMSDLNGVIGTYHITATTAIGSSVITLAGIEAKAANVWAGGTTNTPVIVFRKLTSGATGLALNTAYYIVKGTANTFECAVTKGGAGVKVEGHALEAATTEVVIMGSTEDNTAIGSQAGKSLTTGGGNTLVGENAGLNLTSGEENVAIGCECLSANQTGVFNVAIGFEALVESSGSGNVAIGKGAGGRNTTGEENTYIGFLAGYEGKSQHNTAVGAWALAQGFFGEENTAIGNASLQRTTGEQNTALGYGTLSYTASGDRNTALGTRAGNENVTGSGNVFIGFEAGSQVTASNQLVIANSNTATSLILGEFPNVSLQFNATEMGFFKHTAVTQPAKPAETVKAVIEVLEKLGLCA